MIDVHPGPNCIDPYAVYTFTNEKHFYAASQKTLEQISDNFEVDGRTYRVTWHLVVPCAVGEVVTQEDDFCRLVKKYKNLGSAEIDYFNKIKFTRGKMCFAVVERNAAPERKLRRTECCICLCDYYPLAEFFTHRLARGTLESRARHFERHINRMCAPKGIERFHKYVFIRGLGDVKYGHHHEELLSVAKRTIQNGRFDQGERSSFVDYKNRDYY
ncbi:hypothetical protein FNU76_01835 [Chitinimonas arctica]|uniref:Uncharacterized protein n=1 Tax=Chitinimonas arctica TaxID=2594795 RepID=A0A516SAL2_9NEIS|nr:hypothetical protein [Chitinimonas arctica]QDQ25194.1 hypothetical protein FNU76_01835 [Chitinimonas arctica]